jgi:hypothetical protein
MRRLFPALLIAVATTLAGCLDPLPPLRPDADPAVATTDLAVVEVDSSAVAVESIARGTRMLYLGRRDNQYNAKTSIELAPGMYTLALAAQCYNMGPRRLQVSVELEAGHRYRADGDCCYWWTPQAGCSYFWSLWGTYQTFMWLEDLTAGRLMAGSRTEPAADSSEP